MGSYDLGQRTKDFALRVIRLVGTLPKSPAADVLGKQLLRAGTSVGANYREMRRARSRPDFISKAAICIQETDESLYWLELLAESNLISTPRLTSIRQEANELIAIFSASIKTARRNHIAEKAGEK